MNNPGRKKAPVRKPSRRDEAGLTVHLKVWMENGDKELVMGMGRVVMLEAIERTGSLNQAAQELGMSYRTIWGRLRETEKRMGRKLLVRTTGGREGGGSELTPFARSIIRAFRELNARLEQEANRLFERFSSLLDG